MNIVTAMSLTNGTLIVVVDGTNILTATSDHPKWVDLQAAYNSQNKEQVLELVSVKAVIEKYSVGKLVVTTAGITYAGRALHSIDVNRVMAFMEKNLPFQPIANYMSRKMNNPSHRAINELYTFLENKHMPITPEGLIIAYKGVQHDMFSVHGNTSTVVLQGEVVKGHIKNTIGTTIEVERSSVDDDFRQGCSVGLHAGSWEYAHNFGDRRVMVAIDPADVVSVPSDCNCQKLRCCKYIVLKEVDGPMPHDYTNEFSKTPEVKPEDPSTDSIDPNICPDCDCSCPYCGDDMDICDCNCSESPVPARTNSPNGEGHFDPLLIVSDPAESYEQDTTVDRSGAECQCDFCVTSRKNAATDDESDENEESFLAGMQAGVTHRSKAFNPVYIPGDQDGADSAKHARYINGYIEGYA